MKTLGETLSAARNEKEITLNKAANETNISQSYLEALEVEDFSAFPGEAYLMGFLKIYAEYLELEKTEVVSLYRNTMVRDQETPVDELLKAKKMNPLPLFIVLAVLILGVGSYYLIPIIHKSISERITSAKENSDVKEVSAAGEKENEKDSTGHILTIGEPIHTRVFAGDTLAFESDGQSWGYQIQSVGTRVLIYKDEKPLLKLGKDLYSDTGDAVMADPVLLGQVSEIPVGSTEYLVRFQLEDIDVNNAESGALANISVVKADVTAVAEKVSDLTVSPEETALPGGRILMKSDRIKPILINMNFRDYALLRYQPDKGSRVEKLHKKDDSLTVKAQKTLTLGIANAGAVTAQINGKTLDLGDDGQITYWYLAWDKEKEGESYVLKLHELK